MSGHVKYGIYLKRVAANPKIKVVCFYSGYSENSPNYSKVPASAHSARTDLSPAAVLWYIARPGEVK